MDFQLPKPKNWQDSESICYELWRSILRGYYSQKNAPQGQSQHGVDIYVHPSYASGIYAVQCKGKNDNYDPDIHTCHYNQERNKNVTTFVFSDDIIFQPLTDKKEITLESGQSTEIMTSTLS